MESSNLNHQPADDAQVDAWLLQNTVAPILDDGFTRRVIASLPPRQAGFQWRPYLLPAAGALVGLAWAQSHGARFADLPMTLAPLTDTLSNPSMLFMLAVIATLAVVSNEGEITN